MRKIVPRLLTLALAFGLTISVAREGAAQSEPTRYLPLTSWLTPYVEFLIRAGVLRGLDPLTRPLRRADVARAVADVDTTALGASVRGTLALVRAELQEPDTGAARWSVELRAGALAGSDASKWPLRPTTDSAGLYPQLSADASLELPHLALVTHPGIDNRLRYDPFYRGKKDRFIAGRAAEAYLLASWRYVDVAFGAIDRNWGPPEEEGLFISSAPYSNEHLFVRLGPQRLRLEFLAEQLDPLTPWDSAPSVTVPRYFFTHRLVVQPSSRLTFALNETLLYANPRGLVFRYLNPLTLLLLTQFDNTPTANSQVGADVSWMASPHIRVFGQLMIDDIQVDRTTQGDRKPAEYALTIGASGGACRGRATWTALYTQVLNLVYRTSLNEEQVTLNNIGLARNQSDYDQLTGRVTVAARPGLLIGGEVNVLRQGQGDFRQRFPPQSAWADSLRFLTGVVQRTVNLAATAAWSPAPMVALSGYLGYNAIANANHVSGVHQSRWVWRLQASIHRRYGGALSW